MSSSGQYMTSQLFALICSKDVPVSLTADVWVFSFKMLVTGSYLLFLGKKIHLVSGEASQTWDEQPVLGSV